MLPREDREGKPTVTPYEKALSFPILEEAWHRVRSNRGGPGGDRVDIETYGRMMPGALRQLAAAVRTGGYRPGLLRRVDIPKEGGRVRSLAIPCVADRILQAAVAIVLVSMLDAGLSPDSFAYRPDRSVDQAIARANTLIATRPWIVRTDIRECFGSITAGTAIAALGRRLDDDRLLALVRLWLLDFTAQGHGLPQGSPLSPLLCNLVLDPVDRAMAAAGWPMVRYADDILVPCRGRLDALRARWRLAQALRPLGLALSAGKTRTAPAVTGVDFLGGQVGMASASP